MTKVFLKLNKGVLFAHIAGALGFDANSYKLLTDGAKEEFYLAFDSKEKFGDPAEAMAAFEPDLIKHGNLQKYVCGVFLGEVPKPLEPVYLL